MAFDFDAAVSAPFRMQPGLRKLEPGARQLTPARPGSRHQREKLAVLSAFAGQALLARQGFDAGPALAALLQHAADEHPGVLQWDGRRAAVPALGVAVEGSEVIDLAPGPFGLGDEAARCLRGLPAAWRMAGLSCLAFEEDFAVVDAADAGIPWLAVCLPSFWAPEEKVGRHFAEVHAPVADNNLLIRASEALTRTVTGPARCERFVWTITDHPRLHGHPQRIDPRRWADTPVASAWWRTERQTFIPLPALGQAVFTIHVEIQTLAAAIAAPGRAAALLAAVESMSPAVLDYRGLTGVRQPLLDWLASRA
jgi:dimethylamine monooxygenase subunit A